MQEKAEKSLIPISTRITENVVLKSIRDGLSILSPLIMIISLFILIANFPIPGWHSFWSNLLGNQVIASISTSFNNIFNFMGLLVCIVISYCYGKNRGLKDFVSSLVGLISFLILTPPVFHSTSSILYFGNSGIFMGILIGIVSVELYRFSLNKKWKIKLHDSIPPAVPNSITELLPFGFVILVLIMVKILLTLLGIPSFNDLISLLIFNPLKGLGNSLVSIVIYNFVASFLWVFGINGPTVTNSIWSPILFSLSQDNLSAFQAGIKLPHIYTQQFVDIFTTYGGGGSTLSLLLIMIIVCKSKSLKNVGKMAMIPGIFGINEPVIFGIPIIFNLRIAIPFVIVPIVNTIISGLAFYYRWIPYTTGVMLPWTTPPIISGWLSTGSWMASLLQMFEIVLGMLIYFPFVRSLDNEICKTEETN
ncbi:PTS sugar transporter subunit IIC [Companilactobacillus farciminis]|uniref:PTS sugar transporter subunit IIC n=1 Tax=Companilactobacillus farciminis TaxID=1612 RepID=UPI00232D3C91|nr:PTS transporter subunit EIIC [Companilactobacillus farciminis]WCG36656.1 PTS transporter subunit EIIC [Companilactobacillus farciminis]